jgi:hypothetical protein
MPYFAGETDGEEMLVGRLEPAPAGKPIQSSINRIALFQFLVILYCMAKPTPWRRWCVPQTAEVTMRGALAQS